MRKIVLNEGDWVLCDDGTIWNSKYKCCFKYSCNGLEVGFEEKSKTAHPSFTQDSYNEEDLKDPFK